MADYNGPGNQSPGGSFRAAPYSRAFTGASTLIDQVEAARGASSGALMFVTTVSPTFSYKDSTGTTVTVALGAAPVGAFFEFRDIAMTEIVTLTNATLLVYWHGQPSR